MEQVFPYRKEPNLKIWFLISQITFLLWGNKKNSPRFYLMTSPNYGWFSPAWALQLIHYLCLDSLWKVSICHMRDMVQNWQVLSVNVLFQSGVYTQSREDENSLPCIFPVWLDRSSSLRSVLNLNLTVTQEASHCLPVLWILKTFSTCKPKTSLSRERKGWALLGRSGKMRSSLHFSWVIHPLLTT